MATLPAMMILSWFDGILTTPPRDARRNIGEGRRILYDRWFGLLSQPNMAAADLGRIGVGDVG